MIKTPRLLSGLLLSALLLALMPLQAQDNPFDEVAKADYAGRFASATMKMDIRASGDAYAGTITLKEKAYRFKADIEKSVLKGTFKSGDQELPFSAQRKDDQLVFKAGDTTETLTKVKILPLIGKWSSKKMKIAIEKKEDKYQGLLWLSGKKYVFSGNAINGILYGKFSVGQKSFSFTAVNDGGDLIFKTGKFKDSLGKSVDPALLGKITKILNDRTLWNKAEGSLQDSAIEHIGQKLGVEYKLVKTKEYSCGPSAGAKHRIATFKHVKSGLLMNLIPGGTYVMGDDKGRSAEKPAHQATIKAMLIGRYEVRQSCWDKVGGAAKPRFKGADLPMESVSWDDCQAWLKKAGGGLRLPSESEWEYACRSGTTTQYFWGAEMDDSYCWYDGNSGTKTHAVTEHMNKTNAFGLVDMSGNLWEWCQDQWINDYKNGPRDSQPRTSNSSYRVIRGGGWYNDASFCRSAARTYNTPTTRSGSIGFRVARTFD